MNRNVAVVCPAGMTTVAGTVPAALSDDSAIVNPPAGAMLEIVTVPVAVEPPSREVGATVKVVKTGAVMFSAAVAFEPNAVAAMFAVAFAPTATVVTVKVALVEPDAIVTVAGTVALGLSDVKFTV